MTKPQTRTIGGMTSQPMHALYTAVGACSGEYLLQLTQLLQCRNVACPDMRDSSLGQVLYGASDRIEFTMNWNYQYQATCKSVEVTTWMTSPQEIRLPLNSLPLWHGVSLVLAPSLGCLLTNAVPDQSSIASLCVTLLSES